MGSSDEIRQLPKQQNMDRYCICGLVLGFMISFCRAGSHILGGQVEAVTGGVLLEWALVLAVSVGVAWWLPWDSSGSLQTFPCVGVLTGAFGLVFLFSLFSTSEFLAIAFDGAAFRYRRYSAFHAGFGSGCVVP